MSLRLLPCGPTAVVIEVESTDDAIDLARWLRAEAPPGVIDLVPATKTVLVECISGHALSAIRTLIEKYRPHHEPVAEGALVTIETVYDGEDLPDVAATLGIAISEVITMHTKPTYVAAFSGFVPGFAYLTANSALLQLPRRPSPRPRVPAGSVAIAAGFTGVYPTASPGGWNLLGRTSAVMWDPDRARPALVEPGDRVRFVAVLP